MRFECKKCGHVWVGRKFNPNTMQFAKPKQCPSCHSCSWTKPRKYKKRR